MWQLPGVVRRGSYRRSCVGLMASEVLFIHDSPLSLELGNPALVRALHKPGYRLLGVTILVSRVAPRQPVSCSLHQE